MSIALLQKTKYVKGKSDNEGERIIEPCYPGYGITIGNAIRRVVLSSLPGAAPVGVKIKGVDHEFMALEHLREDILEFILNLKQLRLRIFSDELVNLELEVHGKKTITAGDIKADSNVEIINKDLVLGHITDMAGSIHVNILASQGLGYQTIESREEKITKEIGYIEIDSLFSPVLVAGIKIENVRVGKMTNWEKVSLNIKTDGTISPEEAFNKSVEILIEQFSLLISGASDEKKKVKTKDEEDVKEKSDDVEDEVKEGSDEEEVEESTKKRGRPKKVK